MQYKHTTIKESYEDLSSGRVLYNTPSFSAFPIRLATEVIQRCFKVLEDQNFKAPYSIYDPCCGGGYLLTAIGFLYGNNIKEISASDIDDNALKLAKKNLSLLSIDGLNKRINELKSLVAEYNKDSHLNALKSAANLLRSVKSQNPVGLDIFNADATNSKSNFKVDIIITDFPYGNLSKWSSSSNDPTDLFFGNMIQYMNKETSVLAVIIDKKQKLNPKKLQKLESFNIGKRRIYIFKLNE